MCVFSGVCITADGKSKSISTIIEPFKPVEQLYRCDKIFHVDALLEQLNQDDNLYGYLIIGGDGYLIASISGNKKEILQTSYVDLPKKHNKGGQSSVRFARIAEEKRDNYIRKVAEDFNRIFLQKKYVGIIIAGSGNFKQRFVDCDLIDYRLTNKIVKVIDVAYSFNNGLEQAITESSSILSSLKLVNESSELQLFFNEINKGNEKVVYGKDLTINYLKSNLLEKIIIDENIDFKVYKDKSDDISLVKDDLTVEEIHIIDYLIEMNNRTKVVFITDKTANGSMFCKGFGGIGGLLRYEMVNDYTDNTNIDDDYISKNDEELFI